MRPSTSPAREYPGFRPREAPGALPDLSEQVVSLRLEVRELQARIDDKEPRLGRGTI
jgi:hypothetical protein